jgi:hypothetical protein
MRQRSLCALAQQRRDPRLEVIGILERMRRAPKALTVGGAEMLPKKCFEPFRFLQGRFEFLL